MVDYAVEFKQLKNRCILRNGAFKVKSRHGNYCNISSPMDTFCEHQMGKVEFTEPDRFGHPIFEKFCGCALPENKKEPEKTK